MATLPPLKFTFSHNFFVATENLSNVWISHNLVVTLAFLVATLVATNN